MPRNFLILCLVIATWLAASCDGSKDKDRSSAERKAGNPDDENVPSYTIHKGKLTVLMDNSFTSYFIFRGQAMGFEYEMLSLFAKENDLELEIKVIGQVENILDSLIALQGDLVAANLTISSERLNRVSFTEPLFRTRQVLVQRLPDDARKMSLDKIEDSLIKDRLDLEGKSIMVRKNSSYELVLQNLIAETGMTLDIAYAPADAVTESLIEMVANKELEYTLCDENKAEIFNAYYDNIDIATPMSLSQPIAWAVNKESVELLNVLDSWIEKRKGSLEYNMIINKYFEMTKRKERRISREFDEVMAGNISDYDDLIKKYAADLGWDWKLLSALIYKESKFDPSTSSWRGAVGLMQLMPRTAESYGVSPKELQNPERNVYAGTRHLKMLEDHWEGILADSLEVIKFTLGSYNVGLGHVEDAIRLAEKFDSNPSEWDDNVADMLLKKSIPKYYKDPVVKYGYCRGREPVNYVATILRNFKLYQNFTD